MGAPSRHLAFGDGRAAHLAGLVFPSVYMQMMLIAAALTGAVAIVPESGSAMLYALLNRLINSVVKLGHLLLSKACGGTFRMDAGYGQAFIDIDVAKTAY